jgi:hypothetical protein
MSSSDELAPRWDEFCERPTAHIELRSPAAELAAVLQRSSTDLHDTVQAAAVLRREAYVALAAQAALAVELERALAHYETQLLDASLPRVHRHLRILKDRMLDAICATGIEIERLTGRPTDEVLDIVDVDHWRHAPEFEEQVVAELLEPAVLFEGELLRTGRVVMGAPEQAQDAETAADAAGDLAQDEERERST